MLMRGESYMHRGGFSSMSTFFTQSLPPERSFIRDLDSDMWLGADWGVFDDGGTTAYFWEAASTRPRTESSRYCSRSQRPYGDT